MFSRKLTASVVVGAAAIAVAGGSYGGLRASIRHGRQRVRVELHSVDVSRSDPAELEPGVGHHGQRNGSE
jgi:hypothetical protein